jgi:O-antigen ligase
VLLRGGFFATGQSVFVILAGAAFGLAAFRDDATTLRALRSPPVAILIALGVLAVISATWTIGEPSDAARTGLVVLALAALTTASAVLCVGRAGTERIAVAIAIVAGIAALAGLTGVVLREEPWAERIGGAWRAGGPFEYPPALALLQVSALPALLSGMVSRRTGVASVAALGGVLAAAVVGLSESRLQAALAGLVLLIAVTWPRSTLGVDRPRAIVAAALLVAAGLGVAIALGGYSAPGVTRGGGERLLELSAIVGGTVAGWSLLIKYLGPPRRPGPERRIARLPSRWLAGAVLVGAGVLVTAALAVSAPVAGVGGFTHGRLALWADAVEAARERPLLGAGADSFRVATAPFQDGPTIRFAHDLPLELGVELGPLGLFLGIGLMVACAFVLTRVCEPRALWLLGPGVVAFLVANTVDWQWHFAGAAAAFAAGLGPLLRATFDS